MRISDWSSDVCSSDLIANIVGGLARPYGKNGFDRFRKHLVAVLIENAERLGIGRQGDRADTENESPIGELVEHCRMRRDPGGVRMGAIGTARPQFERPRFGREAAKDAHAASVL